MRVLVTGSKGQLGTEIKALVSNYNKLEFVFTDFPGLDICDKKAINDFFKVQKIDVVINCAAYTAVDKAEENNEAAELVNSIGVSNIVKALEKVKGKLIHISTDYVFNGNNSEPYKESDPVSPIGVYAETKRAGELAVINSDIDAIVIRTSWLYSAYGNNFVKTMLRFGREKESLNVISDQIGTPTHSKDLAKTCLDILSKSERLSKKRKIYHYSNEGVASWYDFAISIMDLAGLNCKVKPIETKDYPTLANRPHYSVLNKTKIKDDFNIEVPHWRESLKECLSILEL